MDTTVLLALALTCAPQVDPRTAQALVAVESSGNPYAIGVVGGALVRQPEHVAEAIATARALKAAGRDFSLGLAQINVRNLQRLGLSHEQGLDPCTNLQAMQTLLGECLQRAQGIEPKADQRHLRRALSCYYSGNFTTGFEHGYVRRVALAAARVR
ncbi:MAG: lytic transglycosylase domain-containing protein [Ideonella sp.]|nr:lytic transglycosylase domain-containing protein [Ideonella sp.]